MTSIVFTEVRPSFTVDASRFLAVVADLEEPTLLSADP